MIGVPSPDGLIVGNAEVVGVRHISPSKYHPPLRVFYPAKRDSKTFNKRRSCAKWFEGTPNLGLLVTVIMVW